MIVFTGDFHIEKGIWISITIDYLNYLCQYCKERSLRTLVINGDIFEKATKIHNEAFVPLFMKFIEMKKEGFELIFLLGNHDIWNDSNDSIVETFSPFGRVIKDSCSLEIENDYFDLLSYTKDKSKIPNRNKTLLTHLPITSFQFDNGFTNVDDGFSPEDFSNYNLVASGHFHRHQKNGNIVYAGSPYEKNFGEEGQEKGFLVINEGKSKFVPYTNAPKHLTINIEDFDKYEYKNTFVQVKINKKVENFVKLRHLLYSRGAIEVRPLFEKEAEEVSLQDVKLDGSGSISTIIKQYLNEVKIEGVENKELIKRFDKLVEEIK